MKKEEIGRKELRLADKSNTNKCTEKDLDSAPWCFILKNMRANSYLVIQGTTILRDI